MLKQGLFLFSLMLCGLVGAMTWNTLHYAHHQPKFSLANTPPILESAPETEAILKRLSQALQTQTISYQDPSKIPTAAFNQLHILLQSSFPGTYQTLKPQRMGHSLLMRWPGQNPKLKPILLAAHLDVVPIENPEAWEEAPFSGKITQDHVWGRGAIDDKGSALAIMEAVESLIQSNYQPQRTLYLAFGADEEIGGKRGAAKIAQKLSQEGIQLAGVIDEGLLIIPGTMIGLQPRVALIGIAEKGYLSIELKVNVAGGHASMPKRETAVDILSRALVQLNEHPLPAHLSGPAGELFRWLGPEMSGLNKVALANLKFFEPLLLKQLVQAPATNALIRTTMAPTMLSGSNKENVLASQAQAVLNLRVLPGDTPEQILTAIKKRIGDDRVSIKILNQGFNGLASKVSSTDSELFKALSKSIRQIFPDALIAPSLVLAATDSRHYENIADNSYRFQPFYLLESDLERLHGSNERIAIQTYLQGIRFYQQLITNLSLTD